MNGGGSFGSLHLISGRFVGDRRGRKEAGLPREREGPRGSGRLRVRDPADRVLLSLLHLPDGLRDLHLALRLGSARPDRRGRVPELPRALPRRSLSQGSAQHPRLHGVRRSRADGARAPRCGDREPEDPRPPVLPRGVLLPVAGVVGRDRGDLHLPAERRRARERDPRHQHHVLRRLRHRAAVDHGPERLDDVGDDDALLPRRTSGDPDRTSTRRPRSTAPDRGARSGRSPSRCSSRGTSSSWSCRSSAA